MWLQRALDPRLAHLEKPGARARRARRSSLWASRGRRWGGPAWAVGDPASEVAAPDRRNRQGPGPGPGRTAPGEREAAPRRATVGAARSTRAPVRPTRRASRLPTRDVDRRSERPTPDLARWMRHRAEEPYHGGSGPAGRGDHAVPASQGTPGNAERCPPRPTRPRHRRGPRPPRQRRRAHPRRRPHPLRRPRPWGPRRLPSGPRPRRSPPPQYSWPRC